MLFRQIVGRALRLHTPEDGTAAQIYIPAFPLLLEFAARLYKEAEEGIRDRRCRVCGEWPCACPCPDCDKHPCECDRPYLFPMLEESRIAIDAVPVLDGGHVGAEHVAELFVEAAMKITEAYEAHRHLNHTQLGHADAMRDHLFERIHRTGHDLKLDFPNILRTVIETEAWKQFHDEPAEGQLRFSQDDGRTTR
jgi:hypothetical protein